MNETKLATVGPHDDAVNLALMDGDLSRLTPNERRSHYVAVCRSLGLNPLTRPFKYMKGMGGGLTLYALKDCAEQLRKLHKISLTLSDPIFADGLCTYKARATTADGRVDESSGAVPIEGKKGEDRANAVMKAETKAKRRVTLSICGLGMLDEHEVDDAPSLERVEVDAETGEVHDTERPPPMPALETASPQQARYAQRMGELAAADNVRAVAKVWNAINADLRSTAITFDQRNRLQDAMTARRDELRSPPPRGDAYEEPSMDVGDDPGGLA